MQSMPRGIGASATGVEQAKSALRLKGWTQEYLAGVCGCTRQTINRFFAGNPIEKRILHDICEVLGIRFGEIAELDADESINQTCSLDELVETIRINIYDRIQDKCGSMQVLDMSHPIDLNAIYTAVNILEKITGRRRLEYAQLLQTCSLENFDRFSLSGIQEQGVPGLNAVNKYSKLMILGKPGAGKTTFLKHLAIQCIEGAFKKELVPLFITLKDFAEAPKQPSLLDYLNQLFESYGIAPEMMVKTGSLTALVSSNTMLMELLLKQGRILFLLDGLDEVRETDNSRVLRQIQDFANQFSKNLFVITCRIAAREYTFERFTEVEVADFGDTQIRDFTTQWFKAKNDPIKAENFIKKLENDKGIRDLATSPILLTLLCIVFEESGSFPRNRSELYKEGLDVLLKKWDVKRNIERDQVYKKLSLKRKEDLLSQIALTTFQQGNYFFKQKDAERYIMLYIRNLPAAIQGKKTLQLDSEVVLKSIEAQHGLFVERARGIYSFSHLTFHEYFTARKIVSSTDTSELVNHLTEKRWREVVLLTVGMLENAETLLLLMKQQIDGILTQDQKLQKFLSWLKHKSRSIETHHKPAAIRAFYLDLIFGRFSLISALNINLHYAPDLDLDSALDDILDCVQDLSLSSALDHAFQRALDSALDLDPEFQQKLQQLQQLLEQRPYGDNSKVYEQWWRTDGQVWAKQFTTVMIQYRNFGHNWRFTDAQEKLLQQYYDANQLLIACLNSDCYIRREIRDEIEATLLLPNTIMEIKNL
jgi:predicted NACHT family NTPase